MNLCGRLMSFELLLWNIIRALSHFTQMVLQSQLGNTPAYYFPGIWEFRELLKGKLYSFCSKAECSCSLHMNSTNGINVNFTERSKTVVIRTPVKYAAKEKRWRIVSQRFILSTQRILEKITEMGLEKNTLVISEKNYTHMKNQNCYFSQSSCFDFKNLLQKKELKKPTEIHFLFLPTTSRFEAV